MLEPLNAINLLRGQIVAEVPSTPVAADFARVLTDLLSGIEGEDGGNDRSPATGEDSCVTALDNLIDGSGKDPEPPPEAAAVPDPLVAIFDAILLRKMENDASGPSRNQTEGAIADPARAGKATTILSQPVPLGEGASPLDADEPVASGATVAGPMSESQPKPAQFLPFKTPTPTQPQLDAPRPNVEHAADVAPQPALNRPSPRNAYQPDRIIPTAGRSVSDVSASPVGLPAPVARTETGAPLRADPTPADPTPADPTPADPARAVTRVIAPAPAMTNPDLRDIPKDRESDNTPQDEVPDWARPSEKGMPDRPRMPEVAGAQVSFAPIHQDPPAFQPDPGRATDQLGLPSVQNAVAGSPAATSFLPPVQSPPSHLVPDLVRLLSAPPDGTVSLTLRPEELGTLHFQMSQTGDEMRIHLTVDQPATLDLLRRHTDQLLSELRHAGFSNATLSFSGGNTQEGPPREQSPTRGYAEDDLPANPAYPASRPAHGALDLRL